MHFKNFMSESNEDCTDKHSISNISEAGWEIMVFNTTFNNISVLLVEETWVPGENHWPVTDKLYHIML